MENKNTNKYKVPEEFKDLEGKNPFSFLTFTRRDKKETDEKLKKSKKSLEK